VLKLDVFRFLTQCRQQFDFIFAGPPYALTNIDDLPKLVVEKKLLKPGGWFVLEHTPRNSYINSPLFKSERNYGTTVFSFFVNDVT
jgi:16S rRNA (guanine966-N2)-methyltransferase